MLSRAARLVLVKAVLQSLAFCWGRVCLLPKKVISDVNALCANFLWKGSGEGKGGHLVNWNDVGLEKDEGGLGIKRLDLMSDAMLLNQLWSLEKSRVVNGLTRLRHIGRRIRIVGKMGLLVTGHGC